MAVARLDRSAMADRRYSDNREDLEFESVDAVAKRGSLGFESGDAVAKRGWMPTMDARARLVHALATADQAGPNADGDPRTGIDQGFGSGRFLAASPAPGALPAPNGWGNRSLSAIEGVHRWPVGSPGPEGNVAEWKWAVAAFPDDLDEIDASWFIVVVDTCPAGGGFEYVAGDFSTDFRKRIVLKGDDIQGRCLEMRLVVLRAPPTGVPVWMTDCYYGVE